MQFDLSFYHFALEPNLGGDRGIPIVHLMDCCVRWSVRIRNPSKTTRDPSNSISIAWANAFGNMNVFTLDGESCMRGKEANDWATHSQISFKCKAPRQKAWLVERHDAPIELALQKAESHVINESLCINFATVFGLATFMLNVFISTINHTFYQALLGGRPTLLPPLEGGYHGDADAEGKNNFARARWIAAIVVIEVTTKQRLARGDRGEMTAVQRRIEHQPGDSIDMLCFS